ncbi:MAG TPA: CpaF family protein [Myxococcales bacterium]|nr:CpaF family protein [Myxococcales bacterium]
MASLFADSLRSFLKPIVPFLDDEAVSEVMVNGPEDIWIEKKGKLIKTEARFTEEGVNAAARNMAQFVGRPLSDERPRLDARLPDGSRIHVVMAPIARKGTTISIRKFFKDKLTIDRLVEFGSMTEEMAHFIDACVVLKENMVVSGGTGSGKTTLLNVLAQFIPNDERVLTIEDSAELQLNQEHLVPFESRPPDKLGKGGVDMGDLLHSALRLRPDRIVVGEVRGGECFHLLQAMNTGHGGSLATTHANTPVDTLRRLESLALMSGVELPMVAVRAQVASAINIIVCCERFMDGSRRTTHVAEVLPLDDRGEYRTQDLFTFTPTHKDEEGRIHGYHAPTGALPSFMGRLAAYGFPDIDEAYFDPIARGLPPPAMVHDGTHRVHWTKRFAHRDKGLPDPPELVATFPKEAPEPKAPAPKPVAAVAPSGGTPKPAPKPAPAATPRPPAVAAKPVPKPASVAPPRPAVKPVPRPSVVVEDDGLDDLDEEPRPGEKTALHQMPKDEFQDS